MDREKSSFQPIALSLTLAAALVRLVPHPPNFAPIGGLALFGGARLKGWQAYLVPVLAMLVTDPLLSRLSGFPAYSAMTPVIYACFILNVLLGRMFLSNTVSPARIGGIALVGSTQFFVITNFFVWLGSGVFYAHNVGGLMACYVAALPFFRRTVMADLFYSGVLFAAHYALTRATGTATVELNSTAKHA
jgi:hypothetical protein